ncbi:MAG: hypothetical protein Q8S94_05290 [Pseudohongiella sp.]|nr:hypothetical protein [Pseudohongiella sp.]MDP3516565.1 hypothetical protein [Pseudohongiella sp.]
MRSFQISVLLFVSIALAACASTPPAPSKAELIIGAWSAEIQGQSMTLVYGEADVTVREFGMSFPYEWVDADNIRLNAMGQEVVSRVEFDSPEQMRQSADGQEQIFRRVQ